MQPPQVPWPLQVPWAVHLSNLVQALPSLHGIPGIGVYTQPTVSLQVSAVQGLPSSHVWPWPWRVPSTHASALVQSVPSSQGPGLGVSRQPPAGWHAASPHTEEAQLTPSGSCFSAMLDVF